MPCPRAGSREEFPAYEQRFAHLDSEEQKDFREQFGDTWDLVATMLGHSNPQTTRSHYLEPFRALVSRGRGAPRGSSRRPEWRSRASAPESG